MIAVVMFVVIDLEQSIPAQATVLVPMAVLQPAPKFAIMLQPVWDLARALVLAGIAMPVVLTIVPLIVSRIMVAGSRALVVPIIFRCCLRGIEKQQAAADEYSEKKLVHD